MSKDDAVKMMEFVESFRAPFNDASAATLLFAEQKRPNRCDVFLVT